MDNQFYQQDIFIVNIHPRLLKPILQKIQDETGSAFRFYNNRTPLEYLEYQKSRKEYKAYKIITSLRISGTNNNLNEAKIFSSYHDEIVHRYLASIYFCIEAKNFLNDRIIRFDFQ